MKRPILIGIGASHSGSGKTFLAARILKFFSQIPSPESLSPLTCGAIKYTRTLSGPELITDRPMLMEHGKDTWQMLTSGAREVIWAKSTRSGLGDLLPEALKRLSHLDLVIVEGNGAIEFLKPDIVIFIFGKGRKHWKPGIEKLAARADIILNDSEVKLLADCHSKRLFRRSLSDSEYMDFFGMLSGLLYERRAEAENDTKGN